MRSGDSEWAPDIEYAFADGYAIELELPFDNLSVAEYKLALQGTFGTLLNDQVIDSRLADDRPPWPPR